VADDRAGGAADASAETAEARPAAEQPPPPDRPGAEDTPSRAESRKAVTAKEQANDQPAEAKPGEDRPAEDKSAEDKPDKEQSEVAAPHESVGEQDTEAAEDTMESSASAKSSAEEGSEQTETPNDETTVERSDAVEVADEGTEPPGDVGSVPETDGRRPGPKRIEQAADEEHEDQEPAAEPPDGEKAVGEDGTDREEMVKETPKHGGQGFVPGSRPKGSVVAAGPESATRTGGEITERPGDAAVTHGPEGDDGRNAEMFDRPTIGEDGSWEWKGLRLDPEQNRIAGLAHAERRLAEGRDAEGDYSDQGITPAMRRIESDLKDGELVGCPEFSLKGEDRFKEKLAKNLVTAPDKSTSEAATGIHDGIRYTFVFDTHRYTDGVRRVREELSGIGYHLMLQKPSWDDAEYKGVNSRWSDPESGQLFEVQFHTPESWEAKQKTHDAYEKLAAPTTPPEEIVRLEDYQREVTSSVPVPPGALEIPYYRKEE
jgi:hypothetical protein